MRMINFVAVMIMTCCTFIDGRYNNAFTAGINRNGASATWTRSGDHWSTSISGSINRNGNVGFGVGLSYRWKRSDNLDKPKLYNVTLQVDTCNYQTYDIDGNGEIILGEFHAIFGDNQMAANLFKDLDENKSGALGVEEFYERVPLFIKTCADLDKEDEE